MTEQEGKNTHKIVRKSLQGSSGDGIFDWDEDVCELCGWEVPKIWFPKERVPPCPGHRHDWVWPKRARIGGKITGHCSICNEVLEATCMAVPSLLLGGK